MQSSGSGPPFLQLSSATVIFTSFSIASIHKLPVCIHFILSDIFLASFITGKIVATDTSYATLLFLNMRNDALSFFSIIARCFSPVGLKHDNKHQ